MAAVPHPSNSAMEGLGPRYSGEMTGREECLRLTVEHVGGTRAGRELGVDRLSSLQDLRSSIPIRDRPTHDTDVVSRLGFGTFEGDAKVSQLAGGHRERDQIVGVWRWFLREQTPRKVALLRGDHFDRAIEDIAERDLVELGGEVLRIGSASGPEDLLSRIAAYDPDVLIVPSALTCRYLESVQRAPLESCLRNLRLILAEHDLKRPVRSRVPVRSAGWITQGGRVGLPSAREPSNAVTLAVASQIVELLPYSNPEEDARRVYARQTVLPEDAIVGQRYEVVVTSPLGLLRLRTNEHVVVVGFDAPCEAAPFPRPRVVRLFPAPADVQLEGCTVGGAWLAASMRQALNREDPALVQAEIGADPLSVERAEGEALRPAVRWTEAFADTEYGWMTRSGVHRVVRARPRRLWARIELQGHVEPKLAGVLAARVDDSLRRRSPAYAHLRERAELLPPRITILEPGTRKREEDARIERLGGRVWLPEVRVV